MAVLNIKYMRANATPRVYPTLEYESGKFFNIDTALKQDISGISKVSGEGFTVNKEEQGELIKALDKCPMVYRAGGEAAGSANESPD